MPKRHNEEGEKYAAQKYNSRSLMEAYNAVVGNADTEFAQEYEQEDVHSEAGTNKYVSGALMSTYAQMLDSYREGTIDGEIEHSKNKVNEIPREGYDQTKR
ncbi:hypothetical protein [Caldalkalibacillus salinus]|uniref:hypothetical protein n=1 Tax=Caldalkalibacillus salinus TaxID=2803787 RepID=UPI0019204F10|nr:hypothetical protein [Caldalkalibacillus salinus]